MAAEYCRLPRDSLEIVVRVQDSNHRMNLVVPHQSSESNSALVSFEIIRIRYTLVGKLDKAFKLDIIGTLLRASRYKN